MEGLVRKGFTFLFASVAAVLGTQQAVAMTLPNPPAQNAGLMGSIGIVSVLRSIAGLSGHQTANHAVEYTLKDGTKIGGLLYVDPSKGVRPLIIADFGLMSSMNSVLAGDVIEKIVNPGLLSANFLVVDDVSGADFYAANRSLSLGGYDAGRILNELADELAAESVPFSHLNLLGESLGGLAVLEALVEDQRLGTKHFQSAITFSGVTDELQATGTVMSAFQHDLSGISGPALSTEGEVFLDAAVTSFDAFVAESPSGSGLALPTFTNAGNLFYEQFTQRLQQLSEEKAVGWNPAIDRSSVESYLESSASVLAGGVGSVSVPIILVHAQNDPVVAYSEFESFAEAQQGNPRIFTLGTEDGSHCGFLGVYGAGWMANLINRSIQM